MPRYVTRRPRAEADCDWWANDAAGVIPTVSDHEATDTGLLDAVGNSIFRVPNPMGFGKDDEW